MEKKSIPFFSLSKQASTYKSLFLKEVSNVIDNQNFVGGAVVQSFEQKFAAHHKIPHAISCNSGTDALWLALKTLDLQRDQIVLTTAFSFIASSSEIAAFEAHPVFIDIERSSYNLDPVALEAWLTTHAVIKKGQTVHKKSGMPVVGMVVVNIFGQVANYTAIKEIAKKWNLWIVEDNAQGIDATLDGKQAGTFGDIGTFSFYPTKNLGAYGEGGACITDNPYYAERLLRLRNHGRKSHYEYEELGINSRLDGMQAAILSAKLDLISGFNQRRREIANYYRQQLAHVSFIKLPEEVYGQHVYHQFCVTTKTNAMRTMFQKFLTENGIGHNIFYPKSLLEIPFLNTNKQLKNPCPVAQETTETILALPIWPELEQDDLDYICDKIKMFDHLLNPQIEQKQLAEKKRMKKEERAQQTTLF